MRGFITLILCLAVIFSAVLAVEKDYTDFVKNLQQKIKLPPFKGSAYERLAYITDSYGPRMWGSSALEQVIAEMMVMAQKEGFENIHL